MKIGNKKISQENKPFVVAEVSANHNGCIKRAIETIKLAKKCGADAVKIQTFKPETMTLNSNKPDFLVKGGLWDGFKLYDLYEKAQTPYDWHPELFEIAKQLDIILFSTPFDNSAVELLESLNSPAYKIASFEITDIPLIKRVSSTGKPILISTGMASEEEINEAIQTAKISGAKDILLYHCVSSYPTPIEKINLKRIKILQKKFNLQVGLSDHTNDNIAAIASIAFGAVSIEKHFTIDKKNEDGLDSEFSIEPKDFKKLIKDIHKTWLALGDGRSGSNETEIPNKRFRRSLYFIKDLKKGEKISKHHIKAVRPGKGLNPKYFENIINKRAKKKLTIGDPVTWDVIE